MTIALGHNIGGYEGDFDYATSRVTLDLDHELCGVALMEILNAEVAPHLQRINESFSTSRGHPAIRMFAAFAAPARAGSKPAALECAWSAVALAGPTENTQNHRHAPQRPIDITPRQQRLRRVGLGPGD